MAEPAGSYPRLFQHAGGQIEWRPLGTAGISVAELGGRRFVLVQREAVAALAEAAFADVSHLFRSSHLAQLRTILDDPEASANDRFVARELLKNAVISAEGEFPSCQDTGTAIVLGEKGQSLLVEDSLHDALCGGIEAVWRTRNLRFSQMAALSMFEERNTGNNLPAQIEIEAGEGDALDLLFVAKGGGSANKTFLFQETRRVLEPDRLLAFLDEKVRTLGAAACPPYHLAIVVGGLSAEQTLRTVKLASTRALDDLPTTGDLTGRAFRDLGLERDVHRLTGNLGLGAQFGGKYFCHDVRVIRLPRHGGSLPIGLGVSCSADRQVRGRIDGTGIWLERLEADPSRYLPQAEFDAGKAVRIDLDRPMHEISADLSALPIAAPVLLTGTMIVARDLVHAEVARRMAAGSPPPDYLRDHPVYYAGPARTPEGRASGSFGPTTAARMDPYMPELQAMGAALVTIAKGNRAASLAASCCRHGGFYLGSVGGAAASLGRDAIEEVVAIDYLEFGMEAVWRIRVRDFPAFLIIDDKGGDFYAATLERAPARRGNGGRDG